MKITIRAASRHASSPPGSMHRIIESSSHRSHRVTRCIESSSHRVIEVIEHQLTVDFQERSAAEAAACKSRRFEIGPERDHRKSRHFELGQERDHRKSQHFEIGRERDHHKKHSPPEDAGWLVGWWAG